MNLINEMYRCIVDAIKDIEPCDAVTIQYKPREITVTFRKGIICVQFLMDPYQWEEVGRDIKDLEKQRELRIAWILSQLDKLTDQLKPSEPGPGAAWGKGPVR